MTTELDTAQRRAQELVGTEELRRLGSVRADEAIAFARASAEDDPRYLEPDSPDFAVHPLYLPSMLRGPRGAVDQDYRSDGMFSDEVPGTAGLGVRLLAGGQDIEFHRSPPFGRPIEVARTVEAVERKGRPESEFLLITVLKTIRITGPSFGDNLGKVHRPMIDAKETRVGDVVEPISLQTDPVRIQRFGAATHNAHRIHYDTAFARSEGLEDRVVMAQLHGAVFFRAAARFAGDPAAVVSVGWQNRAPALVGAVLTVTGTVREVAGGRVTLELLEHSENGTLCAVGHAVVATNPNPVC